MTYDHKAIGIIPARYGSTRFPGKPLALINGKPMIRHVYERAANALGSESVFVATDDDRIFDVVRGFGGNAIMTAADVTNGTARCAAALEVIANDADIILNIQGDEPMIDPADISNIVECFDDESVDIATLARRFRPEEDSDILLSPDNPKVIMDNSNNALYFSRALIPYVRNRHCNIWAESAAFHLHVGTYGFRRHILGKIVTLPETEIERVEQLEQLRWLAAGFRIKVAITNNKTISIDTPTDLEKLIYETRE